MPLFFYEVAYKFIFWQSICLYPGKISGEISGRGRDSLVLKAYSFFGINLSYLMVNGNAYESSSRQYLLILHPSFATRTFK